MLKSQTQRLTSLSTLSCASVSANPSAALPASIMPSWLMQVPSRSASPRGVRSISRRSSSLSCSSSSSSKAKRRLAASKAAASAGWCIATKACSAQNAPVLQMLQHGWSVVCIASKASTAQSCPVLLLCEQREAAADCSVSL